MDSSDNVVFDNVRLEGTADSKHVLGVNQPDNLWLNDVTLDHANSETGAPLIIRRIRRRVMYRRRQVLQIMSRYMHPALCWHLQLLQH